MIDLDAYDDEVRQAFMDLQKQNEVYKKYTEEMQGGVRKILANPKATAHLREAAAEAKIDIQIPENPMDAYEKRFAAMEKKQEENRLWAILKAKGLMGEIEEIKKFAAEHGITNDDKAIELYEKTRAAKEINTSSEFDRKINPFKITPELDVDKIKANIRAGLTRL